MRGKLIPFYYSSFRQKFLVKITLQKIKNQIFYLYTFNACHQIKPEMQLN